MSHSSVWWLTVWGTEGCRFKSHEEKLVLKYDTQMKKSNTPRNYV